MPNGMQTGDVIFFQAEDTFISKTIARFTKFPYTHVALAVGEAHIIEANRFIKTRVVAFELDDAKHKIYRIPDLTHGNRQLIRDYALTFQGFPYDYPQVFSWFVQLLFKTETSLFNHANKVICSELIDYAFIGGGVERKSQERVGDITPGMLLDYYDLREVMEHVD